MAKFWVHNLIILAVFYAKKQNERNENGGKNFYVWYGLAGAGADDDARAKLRTKNERNGYCGKENS